MNYTEKRKWEYDQKYPEDDYLPLSGISCDRCGGFSVPPNHNCRLTDRLENLEKELYMALCRVCELERKTGTEVDHG